MTPTVVRGRMPAGRTSASTRCRISAAALFVNVRSMMRDGSVPATAATLPPADAPRPSFEELQQIFARHGQINLGPPLGPDD